MEALVDVVTGRAAAAAITDEIHRAFHAASFAPPPHPPSRSGTLQGYDGVTVGRDSRAIDESRLTAEVNGRKLVRDLGREAGVVARRRRTLEQDRLRAEERARDVARRAEERARDEELARDVARARAAARRDAERLGRRSRRTPGRGRGL
jgi:hypothetical protein